MRFISFNAKPFGFRVKKPSNLFDGKELGLFKAGQAEKLKNISYISLNLFMSNYDSY